MTVLSVWQTPLDGSLEIISWNLEKHRLGVGAEQIV